MWEIEQGILDKGINIIAGVDEAGRGPWAGPVVAAAVIIPAGYAFKEKIADSKKLSLLKREKAFKEITENCDYAIAVVSEKDIDRENILRASLKAMAMALSRLKQCPQWVLVDGPYKPPIENNCTPIIDGDAKSLSIASASIVAKVTRDNLMLEYDKQYPVYGFASHKGYGTKAHRQAILQFGPCPIHRKSFQPIKGILQKSA
ncbi:MAG: ribonuclease HII [Candidatus Omnitrophota bacterium]